MGLGMKIRTVFKPEGKAEEEGLVHLRLATLTGVH
jgi:hypothetical protein